MVSSTKTMTDYCSFTALLGSILHCWLTEHVLGQKLDVYLIIYACIVTVVNRIAEVEGIELSFLPLAAVHSPLSSTICNIYLHTQLYYCNTFLTEPFVIPGHLFVAGS